MFILRKFKRVINRLFCFAGVHEFRLSSSWQFTCGMPHEDGSFITNKSIVHECRYCKKTEQEDYVNGKRKKCVSGL